MDLGVLNDIFTKVFRSEFLSDPLTIAWHAGEPLALGLSFYERAFELIDNLNINRVKIEHNFQTNATLITPSWVNFFRRHGVSVGISIDGPKDLHDKYRVSLSGSGTYDAVMRGVRLLREGGLPLGALCVVTSDTMLRGAELFQFYLDEGFTWLGLNIENPWGGHVSTTFTNHLSGLTESDFEELVNQFWSDLYDAWLPHRHTFTIREIAHMIGCFKELQSDSNYSPEVDSNQPCRNLTFGREGGITTFSPEMLSGIPSNPDIFVVANIKDLNAIHEIQDTPSQLKLADEISRGVDRCKVECAYFQVCGGGTPSSKYSENGTFDCTQTRDCRYGTQLLADTLISKLKRTLILTDQMPAG